MVEVNPYLSVVVTTRNDNHGGDLNHRTQIFISSLSEQVAQHQVPTELILVEWNPPKDRPPLSEAFAWPTDNKWLTVKVITVPEKVHRQFKYSDKLPLYQMIGKNVGVRRAKGKFILSTNIDLVFSPELFAFLASGKMEKGTVYRCDRVDVDRNVPLEGGIEARVKYCRSHVLRICRKDGMWIVPQDAPVQTTDNAVHTPYVGVNVEAKWRRQFREFKQMLRDRAVIFEQQIGSIDEKIFGDNFFKPVPKYLTPSFAAQGVRIAGGFAYSTVRDSIRVPDTISFLEHCRQHRELGFKLSLRRIRNEFRAFDIQLPPLHYNACGDFLLMDRDSWFRIQGSPETEAYSLHLDSLTLITAYKEGLMFVDLPSDHVAFHIEHGGGWTPEQEVVLFRRMNTRGIKILSYVDYLIMAQRLLQKPKAFFSDANWGLATAKLEVKPVTGAAASPSHVASSVAAHA